MGILPYDAECSMAIRQAIGRLTFVGQIFYGIGKEPTIVCLPATSLTDGVQHSPDGHTTCTL